MPRDELDAFDRLYLNHGLLATWDGAVTMLAGTGVGGGTLVNWMTCIAAPDGGPRRLGGRARPRGRDRRAVASDVAAIEAELGVAEPTHIPPKDAIDPARRPGARLGGGADAPERDAAAATAAAARSAAGAGPSSPGSGPTSPRRRGRRADRAGRAR